MGMGMLFAGALTGGANAVGQLADDAIKQRERDQVRQQLSQASGLQAQKAFVRATRAKYQIKVAEDRL